MDSLPFTTTDMVVLGSIALFGLLALGVVAVEVVGRFSVEALG